jgi:L,D-transpeptidase-like protein
MTVAVDGTDRYTWLVSTGRPMYATPSGTYSPSSMNEVWYSKEWDNAPMPHAIFFMKDGHAIHGSYEVKTLGKPVSHGCVRISPQNATVLYGLVKATGLNHTQVVLTGTTPGGEEKVAGTRRTSTASRYTLAPDIFPQQRRGDIFPQQRRGGFFRRLFGGQ